MRDLDLHFRQLHAKDDTPIETRRVCSKEDDEVAYEEIGNAYDLDGSDVILTDEELSAADPKKTRTIEIESFVELDEIDPIYFDHPYFLVPAGETDGTVRAYRLLAGVMEQHRPRRARALRPAHQGVPRRDPRPRAGADALDHAALPRRGPPDRRHPRRRRADEARPRSSEAVKLIEALTRRVGPGRLRGRVPQAAAGDRPQEAQGRRDQGARRPTRSATEPVPDLMAALEESLALHA